MPDAEGPLAIPCGAIEDAPDAAYRSVMIDVARQPHTIRVLEDVVRLARLARIRFVHLHLTDDQLFTFPFAPVTDAIANNTAYTRGELAGLVQYASDRGVTLVPEIDLPGHSRRLIESGYLPDAASHADVASERHWERLSVLLADVMDVFERSLYFHIGGDESQAGAALVPFLARVNALVRERGKRLIVWEGFHGAPVDMIPSTGPDRVLVAAWESSYNPPWDLLAAGYEIINASWAPLYIVGGGGRVHPGATGGRRWEPSVLAGWDRHTFMHWEPGRPVFEDRGPADDDRDDGIWRVPQGAGRGQVLGGQVSVWEQHERSLLGGLRHRLPVVGARLWNPDDDRDLLARLGAVDDRLWGLVQPVSIEFDAAVEPGPMNRIAAWRPAGSDADANANAVADADADAKATANADAVADADANPNPNPNPNPNANANANATPNPPTIRLRNRTAGAGTIRWSWRPFGGDWGWIDFRAPDVPATECTGLPIRPGGSGTLRVGLYAGDGTRIGGETWWQGLDWPARVQVTEYAIGRRTPRPGTGRDGGRIPDFDALGPDAITARYRLPILRGPIDHEHIRGQRFEATIQSPGTGTFELGLKTQNGHATAWIDLNRDGVFSEAER
ncbi:MAG: family 20 glycosylhydrolase, partial [Phycisphaerales bacterium]